MLVLLVAMRDLEVKWEGKEKERWEEGKGWVGFWGFRGLKVRISVVLESAMSEVLKFGTKASNYGLFSFI